MKKVITFSLGFIEVYENVNIVLILDRRCSSDWNLKLGIEVIYCHVPYLALHLYMKNSLLA